MYTCNRNWMNCATGALPAIFINLLANVIVITFLQIFEGGINVRTIYIKIDCDFTPKIHTQNILITQFIQKIMSNNFWKINLVIPFSDCLIIVSPMKKNWFCFRKGNKLFLFLRNIFVLQNFLIITFSRAEINPDLIPQRKTENHKGELQH